LQERLEQQTDNVRTFLAGALRQGLTVEQAGERYCALSSPELHQLLTAELGWPAERHEQWLANLLHTELLGSIRLAPE